jgi:hypothetical protein
MNITVVELDYNLKHKKVMNHNTIPSTLPPHEIRFNSNNPEPGGRLQPLRHLAGTMLVGSIVETSDMNPQIENSLTNKPIEAHEYQDPLQAGLSDYFEDYLSGPCRDPKMADDDKTQKYQRTLTETALNLFSRDSLEPPDSLMKYNPLLYELGHMLTSIDHNAGIYYSDADVEGIFRAVAQGFFANENTQHRLQDQPSLLGDIVTDRASEVSSVGKEVALAVIKNESGEWVTVGAQQYNQTKDFTPLEVMRQDNVDKAGWNKYRIRAPKYTRHSDDMYNKPVGDGWYTSEWYKDPNYWSATIRSAILDAAGNIDEKLAGTNMAAIFSTEGGVFKGTATPGTDLDTVCRVVCDSSADFEKAHAVISQNLTSNVDTLPFPTKGEDIAAITITYIDRTSGESFYRQDSNGEYHSFGTRDFEDEQLYQTVRKHEKGMMVIAHGNVMLYRKPPDLDDKETVTIAVSTKNGEAHRVANRPKANQTDEPQDGWI